MRTGILLLVLFLVGCSHHAPSPSGRLSDSRAVAVQLNQQLGRWHGTPYRYGGLSHRGVDCSGFVYLTFRDRFEMQLPRSTREQSDLGTRVRKEDLVPGDLVFFKTGEGENGLHVGIYDRDNTFIHASTRVGVTRSSLNNSYWRKVFWQARRL
ncbi:C40 family peptidase [Candidatus Pantoea multigeneris]|uniref:Endopeptidase n=1 Tax=Candidatus Pantoea multigeneris TaxID=2608357 RepID=A0ABX0R4S3_9GAMM|nr:NlpC/P60 family protein [Pantoea multigeneris]NIF20082.1 endopeptidase [Pantoea multigeneris]